MTWRDAKASTHDMTLYFFTEFFISTVCRTGKDRSSPQGSILAQDPSISSSQTSKRKDNYGNNGNTKDRVLSVPRGTRKVYRTWEGCMWFG